MDLSSLIISCVSWSLVSREFRCFLVTITRIFFMINSFLTVLSNLYDFTLSSGSTVSFFDVFSWSLLEYFEWMALFHKSLRPVWFFTVFWFTCFTLMFSCFYNLNIFQEWISSLILSDLFHFSLSSGWFFIILMFFLSLKLRVTSSKISINQMAPKTLQIFGLLKCRRQRCC